MDLVAVEYRSGEVDLKGYLARPVTEGAPLVVIAHEAMGLTPLIKSRARRLAEHGYAAFALDLYGSEDLLLAEAQLKSAEVMRTSGLLRQRAFAGLQAAAAHPGVDASRVAAVGYCQGGQTVLELARGGAPLVAAIGIHPGFERPAGSADGRIRTSVMVITGDDDPVVKPGDRERFVEELRASGADWQLHVLGGVGHSFTNPDVDAFGIPGFIYDAQAEHRAWTLMLSLLHEVFSSAFPI